MAGAIPDVMDVVHSCRCCLRRAPDKDLTTTYSHLGTTEIYLEMLKECFEIHLILSSDEEVGICDVCVGRLRDASDFKLQVLHSQAELQARLQGALQVKAIKKETPAVESIMEDGDWSSEEHVLCAEVPIEVELKHEDEISDGERQELLVPWAGCADSRAEPARPVSARAREQLAMAGSVRLERLRGDEAPHASQTYLGTHSGKKTYTCDECNKQFRYKGHLIRHVRIHTGIKPYSCKECDKLFTQKQHLDRHSKIHTGEKPYGCNECNKQFRDKGDLTKHERIHTGVKPYGCNECNKQFRNRDHLDAHKVIHTGRKPFSCDECKKEFRNNSNLRRHERVHTGFKPFSCKECDKRFTQKQHLNIHLRIHTGVKPYSCNECNTQFTRKDSLDRHKRMHTGNE